MHHLINSFTSITILYNQSNNAPSGLPTFPNRQFTDGPFNNCCFSADIISESFFPSQHYLKRRLAAIYFPDVRAFAHLPMAIVSYIVSPQIPNSLETLWRFYSFAPSLGEVKDGAATSLGDRIFGDHLLPSQIIPQHYHLKDIMQCNFIVGVLANRTPTLISIIRIQLCYMLCTDSVPWWFVVWDTMHRWCVVWRVKLHTIYIFFIQ